MSYLKKYDIVIIIIMVLVGLGSMLFLKPSDDKQQEKIVTIYSDNELLKTIELTDQTSERYTINNNLGYNMVVVEKGRVYIVEADCPDSICIKDGEISAVGEVLVCLPHKLLVEIKGLEKQIIDGVSQ